MTSRAGNKLEKNVSGIYKLTNVVNGRYYVGQSTNCYYRIYTHFKKLTKNKHHNPNLQTDFNEIGKLNFKTQVIEKCDVDSLNDRETYWLDFYKSLNDIQPYNIFVGIFSRKSPRICSEETRQKLSKIAKNWLDNNKPENVNCTQEEWIENREKGLTYKVGRWTVTHESENIKIHKRGIWAVNIETRNITEYESAAQCEKELNIGNTLILKCIHGFQKRISTGEMSEKKIFWQAKGFRFFDNYDSATEFAKSGITKNPTPNRGKSRDSEIILKKDQEIKTFRTFEEVGKFLGMDRFVARYKITKHTHIQDWEVISCKRIK